MVRRIFATLCCCVLLFFGTQVELAHTPNIDTSALTSLRTQYKPDPPKVAGQTNNGRPATGFFFPRKPGKLSSILSMQLDLPASRFISWSQKMKAFLDMPMIQQNCLATAVYFEARSESMVGQLAVAMVVLNRVKASNSSSSICGVVYKGASHLNACQFSFACDGKPDIVDDARAWMTAHAVTALALANDRKGKPLQILATATNYHADYVDPVWSKSLNRLTKIGRHIFYSQG